MIARKTARPAEDRMILRILMCAALLSASQSIAAELEYIGKALPQAAGTETSRLELADWSSVALEELPGKIIANTLANTAREPEVPTTRGRKEIELYRNAAPAVVLVVTKDSIGSGTHIGGGQIVTNWHVVGAHKIVGVLFKPLAEGAKLEQASVVRADVIKTDSVRDLALLRASGVPASAKVMEFGTDAELQIGADVHAIGHPTGETWTYTRGLISQIRLDYEWKAGGATHRANVIQTQTPINPGNSGGPLIGDSGKLLGVNSFKSTGEGLNFAVSVKDVATFIATRPERESERDKPGCKAALLYDGRDKANEGRLLLVDTNCDGRADATYWYPDDVSKPYQLLLDTNHDGKVDVIVEDTNRDGKWDISYHDTDHDGTIDLVGYHPDGKLQASRFERYASR
jgi:S1-C subfamily serine protease